jgi:phospholipid/cholesterol/gamma-HCH transport system ATP-binding protein
MSRAYQLDGRIIVLVQGELIETGNRQNTEKHLDPRVQQFIKGLSVGPLSGMQ